jgi:anti-anti-sigma factor
MTPQLHDDAIFREETIARYLAKKLDPASADAFEDHYLACQECFEEVRAAEMLIYGLGQRALKRSRTSGVTVIRFSGQAELTRPSSELSELAEIVRIPGDTKVLIDLSGVSRIDSAGLGMLMRCYTHAVRNAGVLKLLHPNRQVKSILSMTGIDSVVPTFEDERAAFESFR